MVRGRLRHAVPLHPARDGAAVVLPDRAASAAERARAVGGYRHSPRIGDGRVFAIRSRVLFGNHPRRHSGGAARAGQRSLRARHDLRPGDEARRAAAGLPRDGAASAHAGDRALSGHVARLRDQSRGLLPHGDEHRRPRRHDRRNGAVRRGMLFRGVRGGVGARQSLQKKVAR